MKGITETAIGQSYDRYYSTGLYGQRYPRPNPNMMNYLTGFIDRPHMRVLDFGCGSGRYAIPLLEQSDAHILAYDISSRAISDLEHRASALPGRDRLTSLTGPLPVLLNAPAAAAPFDLILLMFGVLGHVPGTAHRRDLLTELRGRLAPNGKLVVTVPNKSRRFFAEQRETAPEIAAGRLEPGDILYRRRASSEEIDLYYHLYTLDEFRQELTQAGFRLLRVFPESVLQEKTVLSGPILCRLDRFLSAITPLSMAYGFAAVVDSMP